MTSVRLLLAALMLLPALAPLASAAPTSFTINVVDARSLGCSPDFFTSPDLRVRVLVDGAVVGTTEKAQDRESPIFGFVVQASAQLPATIGIEVEEAEPAGFFGTSWVSCNVGPGAQTRATFTFNGEAALAQTVRGDGDKAAEATVVVGTSPPATPALTTGAVATDSVEIRWSADSTGQATAHRVAHGAFGPVLGFAEGSAATIGGLCDNSQYRFRVIRDAGAWHVASLDHTVKTANAPPRAPLVLSAIRSGNVSFETATTHDIQRFEIHAASSQGFTPSDDTLRKSVAPFIVSSNTVSETDVAFRATDMHVIVRSVDTGGLTAVSASFPIDAPARGGTGEADRCGTPHFGASPPPTQPSPYRPVYEPVQPTYQPTPTRPEQREPERISFPDPTFNMPPCCYRVEATVHNDDGGTGHATVVNGGELDVTIRNTGNRTVTVDMSISDRGFPKFDASGEARDHTVQFEPLPEATITLDVNASRRMQIPVRAVPGTPEMRSVNAQLDLRVREGNMMTWAWFLVDIPADLRNVTMNAEVDVKFDETPINATAGTQVERTVLIVNRASYAVTVEAILAPGIRFDEDIGRAVVAWGYEARPNVRLITLAPYSKQELRVVIDIPENATLGEKASAQLRFQGNNSVKVEELRPAFFNVEVTASSPAAQASISAGGAKGNARFALVAAGVAGAGGVAAFAFWSRRDAARFAMAAMLYSRLAKSEVLDHPGREEIRSRIAAAPGICYSELKSATGMNTGALMHHLRQLERASVIASRKEGAYRRFYLVGAAPAARTVTLTPVHTVPALTPTQERVLALLSEAPLTQGELAARMGLSQQGVNHHVKAMERAGHIEAFHDGRAWRYRAKAPVEA